MATLLLLGVLLIAFGYFQQSDAGLLAGLIVTTAGVVIGEEVKG